MTDNRAEWRKQLDKARMLAWLARGRVTAGPEHPDTRWSAAIEAWHMDGDKDRLTALVGEEVQPSPEMMACVCKAIGDALRGDRTRLRNSMTADLRRTLDWRAARSWWIKRDMKPTWEPPAVGYGLNQAVADRVNEEWKKKEGPWRVPFSERHRATERTVADNARELDRKLRQ